MPKQGFKNTDSSPYVYQETASASVAWGLDDTNSGQFTITGLSSAGAVPQFGQLTIDPSTDGNIEFDPNGTGIVTTPNPLTTPNLTVSTFGAGVVQTNGTGIMSSSNGTDGQVLIGGGSAPAWANITSSTLTITNGANTINIENNSGEFSGGATTSYVVIQSGTKSTVTDYTLGTTSGADLATVVFDTGSDITTTNPITFTAASTGKYYFQMRIESKMTSGGTLSQFTYTISTTNRDYSMKRSDGNETNHSDPLSVCADMTSGDTAVFSITNAIADTFDVNGCNASVLTTWVSGCFIGS